MLDSLAAILSDRTGVTTSSCNMYATGCFVWIVYQQTPAVALLSIM